MNKFISQKNFLKSKGIDKSSPVKLRNELKKEHRKLYMKWYRAIRKDEVKQITIRVNKVQTRVLEAEKVKYNIKSLSKFILQSSMAYLDQKYLVPNIDLLNEIKKELQGTTNNINQVVNKLHNQMRYKTHSGSWDDSAKNLSKIIIGYELLLEQVKDLRLKVEQFTARAPDEFVGLHWVEIKDDPKRLKEVVTHLLKRIDKISNADN